MISTDRKHLSYSQINQFLRICPMQYAFQRVYGLEQESVSESLPFGSAIHRTAEHLWASRMDGLDVSEQELVDLFAELWKRQVKETTNLKYGKSDFDSLLQQGQSLIRVYRQGFPADIQIVGYNVPFQVPLIDQNGESLEKPLVGEIDLLVRDNGRLVAVDLKTSGQRYTEAKIATDLQPTVYLYALRMIQPEEITFRWDVLVKNKMPLLVQYPADRTEEDFRRMIEMVKLMQAMIDAEHFIPNEGCHFCSGCGYQDACRKWHTISAHQSTPAKQLAAV